MEPNPRSAATFRALTIAGFDPSGRAGVLADVRTFRDFGLVAVAAITSVTFQNADHGFGAVNQSAETVRNQIVPLFEDFTFACAKTGMLPTSEVVSEVARLFRETELPLPVVDPVIVSSSGQRLMEQPALETLIRELLPVARVVTPNIPEAEALTGMSINSEETMREAAARIRAIGAPAVLIKGGHLEGKKRSADSRRSASSSLAPSATNLEDEAVDLLDDNGEVTVFRQPRIAGPGIRGSGCMLSTAIAAGLGNGKTLVESVEAARSFVLAAIRAARASE